MLPWEQVENIPFSEKDEFKKLPGTRWDVESRVWLKPKDFETYQGPKLEKLPENEPFAYQRVAVERTLLDGQGFLCNFETGTGKSYYALGVADKIRAKRTLIICTAMTKKPWEMLGQEKGFSTVVIEPTKRRETSLGEDRPELWIVNYENLDKLLGEDLETGEIPCPRFNLIVCDESHRIKNAARGKYEDMPETVKLVFKLKDLFPDAVRLCLTATPLANTPIDVWNQLNWIWPGRFGKFWSFASRYHEVTKGPYGMLIGGPRNTLELKKRLEWVSMAWLKSQCPALPDWDVSVKRGTTCEEYLKGLAPSSLGSVCILTHTRKRAEMLAAKFPEFILFHGKETAAKRWKLIEQAKRENRPIVTTMHAVREGIDLTNWCDVVYDQLGYTWLAVTQSMGRFHRLSSVKPVKYLFLISNPLEERKAVLFCKKLKEIKSVIGVGVGLDEFLGKKYEEKDFLKELASFELGDMSWSDE
jgi:superfamily II DNA or RNA helicase